MQNNTPYTYINIININIYIYIYIDIYDAVQAVCAFSSTDSWYFVYKTEKKNCWTFSLDAPSSGPRIVTERRRG